ncbi:hypothetical protein GobsT_07190 [Gemmata obscuriglobus]|nr:hypothetical protein GobsT_07190 [Gemmata obscuriglobus]VTS00233.1 unnamed protein product [Gemmata obscuriglobus UQM 2246]
MREDCCGQCTNRYHRRFAPSVCKLAATAYELRRADRIGRAGGKVVANSPPKRSIVQGVSRQFLQKMHSSGNGRHIKCIEFLRRFRYYAGRHAAELSHLILPPVGGDIGVRVAASSRIAEAGPTTAP